MFTKHQSEALNAVADRGRELDVAATKIQARYRGHNLRKTRKEEYDAASKLQARYRGFATRKTVDDKRRRRDEQMAYEKGNREREYRMKQREEQKAMLMDLPAGEVEDWQTQQEHVAATTVQANWKRHQAKKNFGAEREARSAAAAKIQRQYRQHNKQKPPSSSSHAHMRSRRQGGDDDDEDADVLMGSMDWGGGAAEEMFSVTRPVARQQKTIDQIVNSRKMDARREMEAAAGVPSQRTQQSSSSAAADADVAADANKTGGAGAGVGAGGNGARSSGSGGGGVTMEAWSEGRQRTRRLLQEYRETAPKAAAAAGARRKACRQAEAVYRAQRATRHGSLAELPSDAKPNQFPSPVGVNEKVTQRLHAEALEAAQVESKWWKPLLALNREQKVLDQQEAERRSEQQWQEDGGGGGGGGRGGGEGNANRYKSNRDRAGVHLTPTKSGVGRGAGGAGGGFGIEAELF